MSNRSFGVILLCVWLILTGILSLTNFRFEAEHIIMGLLALSAGVLILLGK